MTQNCSRAEILAGAIALGEASEAEREEYRRHIATCSSCLGALGGEREIERVMAAVAQARDVETWEPLPRRPGERSRARTWRTELSVLAAAVVISFAVHALAAAILRPPAAPNVANVERSTSTFHVTLEHRAHVAPVPSAAPRVAKASPAPRSMVVVHNVVERHGSAVTQTTTQTTVVAQAPMPQITAPASNVPIWRRDEAMPLQHPAQPANAAVPVLGGHAESIAVAPLTTIRDVVPIGGDGAIKPRPAAIAYEENAQGTTAFEVLVDERGEPTKCTIAKSSGYLALDVSVCKAAMAARYSPRTVNGKPTTGIYRDAFTFRPSSDEDSGIPQ
ncbi:MAG TPA: TonB family protein [Verrucomicrobiae bacterium]|nr:TonB family protein [Verrucomicrobiae bacterium]